MPNRRDFAYSFVQVDKAPKAQVALDAADPAPAIEVTVREALGEAAAHLTHDEYGLALHAYEALAALIVAEISPTPPASAPGIRPPLVVVLPQLMATASKWLVARSAAPAPSTPVATRPLLTPRTARRTSVALPLGRDAVSVDVTRDDAAALRTFYERRVRAVGGAALAVKPAPLIAAAYLPHLYGYVIPMAIGDCHAGLGAFVDAEASYRRALEDPYLELEVEVPQVWTRLAELALEQGDHAYRRAGNAPGALLAVRAGYERIVTATGVVDRSSPLYADARFEPMRARVEAIAQAPDPLALDEDPVIAALVLRARARLDQLAAGLNFFGFAPDYVPPLTFEHLQGVARYFAQQAGRLGGLYVNFKAQAEREELGRDQLDQQVEVARATVALEGLHAEEARTGQRVAERGLAYAALQQQHAVEARDAFAAVRWELQELSYLEAWSSAAAVDEDDEIKQTTNGYTYYSATKRRRSLVLADLAARRTRISHDLEAARLEREIASAGAYRAIAQAQLEQARVRVRVAEKRQAIAALQQRSAEANRDFVDGKELGAGAWYELARSVRALARRYLDMATEAAFLMERAYALETGRALSRIRFDLASSAVSGALAGELLLADIDSFTQDYLGNVRSKRAPAKLVVSLADQFPTAFRALRERGRASFETELAQLERGLPGAWLAKLRNVELVFVGLGGASGLQGTLRNIGLSRIRDVGGAERVVLAPADVLPLTQYEPRQDALLFRFNANELRVFENCGFATRWQLDLPPDANDFDYADLLDVQLVLYFDAYYDTALEDRVRAALPPGGTASRAFSLALSWPDELFYLRNQGAAEVAVTPAAIARSQTAPRVRSAVVRALGAVGGLVVRLTSAGLGREVVVTLDADGMAAVDALVGHSLFDRWRFEVRADDNPGRVAAGVPALEALVDLQVFVEYDFTYRTGA